MPLKSKNLPLLSAFVLAHAALLLFVLGRSDASLAAQGWLEKGIGALVLSGVVLILSDVLSDVLKERIVFWRWSNRLPGCRAFSQYLGEDSRLDPLSLERKHGPLPLDPAQQNRLWYGIFKTHRDKPGISQSHGRYLLLREMAAISAVIALPLGAAALALGGKPEWSAVYAAFLAVQSVLVSLAANNAGVRLVKNTLAEECA